MQPTDDSVLLRQFAENNSDEAFAALVTRHVNLVYSVALRQMGNPQAAEEIAQAVFIILAKKAAQLRHDKALSSWLFQTTRLTASNFIRSETRRHRREEEAYMQSVLDEAGTEIWPRIAPLLDDAVAGLREKDRQAIVLRFYEGRNLREVGLALGTSEDAAEKRVSRALEKLRKFFTKRGVSSTTEIIAGTISANSVQAAPVVLAKTVTAMAIAKGAAASGSTLTLIKGALKIMAWTKIKTVIVTGIIVLLVAGATTVTVHQIKSPKYNPNDFWATTYPTGPADMMQYMTNSYGHPLNYTFPISPVQGCSISGLLNQCMEVSGWHYLIDKDVSAGSVKFGCSNVMNGEEWVAAFENALQTGTPEWWDGKTKKFHHENLVLVRFPKEKTILVLPKDKAAKYQ